MNASKPFIDHRIYTIRPRGMAEFIDVFDRLAMPVQLRYLGAPVGFYMSDIGALNQVVHLWGYESIADYDMRRTARDADPEWPAYLQASAHLIVAQESRIIRRVAFRSLSAAVRQTRPVAHIPIHMETTGMKEHRMGLTDASAPSANAKGGMQ